LESFNQLCVNAKLMVNTRDSFLSLMQPVSLREPSHIRTMKKIKRGACSLSLLRGHVRAVNLIAGFAGVVQGMPLRNVREVAAFAQAGHYMAGPM
jgi:hypothetical protein